MQQNQQATLPQTVRINQNDTIYINNKGTVEPQTLYNRPNQKEIIYKPNPEQSANNNIVAERNNREREVIDVVSTSLITSQLAKLLSTQQETNRLLQNQQSALNSNAVVVPVSTSQKLDSLESKITFLEQKMILMDSLLLLKNEKDNSICTNKKQLDNAIDAKKTGIESDKKKPELANIKAIITYPINQSEINDLQRTLLLNTLIKEYENNGMFYVILESYTDASGTSDYNTKLAKKRMDKVIQFLATYGVNSQDIISKNYGDKNATEMINKEQRKIIIKLIDK
jgi:outer membrane protein OmpA-like peptidoglycan-associated protein